MDSKAWESDASTSDLNRVDFSFIRYYIILEFLSIL